MAVSVKGKVVLDTNVFVDYLRLQLHSDWVFGNVGNVIRFLPSVVLMELRFGADTPRRKRAVDRIKAAFPASRLISPDAESYDWAGSIFRRIHGNGSGLKDRLGPMNDLLIALTARGIGATVITRNLNEFEGIAAHVPGLKFSSPD